MASKPFADRKRGIWRQKYRPDPLGPWVTVTLCKDPRLKPNKPAPKPPLVAEDRAHEFSLIEYRAKHGMSAGPARAKGLAGYLADYVDAYAGHRRKGSVKQVVRHVETFRRFAAEKGIDSVQAVTKATCRDYLEARIKVVGHNALRTERGFLMPIWTRAVEDGLVAANPWAGTKVPGKPGPTSITFWTAEEIGQIVAACQRPWHGDLVLVLANTGIRISTVLAMEWKWVDWARGTIAIPPGEDIKTSYKHVMGRGARDVLERRQMTGDHPALVFPNPRTGRKYPYDSARTAIERAVERAKVRPGTAHDLRHSYGRALALAGVPVTVIQKQLGHSTLTMSQKYMTTDQEHIARFVEGFGVGEAS